MFESSTLEVVKVTVDRREQDIQKYAGSANAFSGDELERIGVSSVKNVSAVAPSVEVGVQEGNTEVFIRGLGSNNNTELGDPSAATHIDGIYIPRPRGVGSMFFDLERLEINRGPQGTIRGRNALAGSLNIITAKPKLGEFASEASFQLGNYSQRVARGMVNVALTDRLALRLAGMGENHDSFYTNSGANTAIKGAESADVYAFRPSVKWVPTDALTFNVSADYTQERGTGYSGSNFSRALSKGIMPNEIPDPRNVYYSGVQGFQDVKQWGIKGDVVLDVGPVLVQYLGGYRDLDFRQLISGSSQVMYNGILNDPPNSDDYSASHWHTRSKSQVHEIRIYAPDQNQFRWTLGGFFFRESQFAFLGNTADQSGGWRGVEFNMPDVKGQSEAGYLDGTFDISKIWRVLGGVRITHETKSRKGIGNIYGFGWPDGAGASRMGTPGFAWAEDGRPSLRQGDKGYDPNAAYGMGIDADPCKVFLDSIAPPAGKEGVRDNIVSTYRANGCGGSANLQPQNGSYGAKFFDFRLGTDYDIAPGHMAYLTVSTGHASGGFNDNLIYPDPKDSTKRVSTLSTYKPEMVLSTEVGSKNEFLDRKIKANVAVFDYEYYNQVLQSVIQVQTDPNNPKAIAGFAVRDNIARSRVLGVELDGDIRLPYNLTVSILGSFLYSRVLSGTIFDGRVDYSPKEGRDSDQTNIKGKTLPRSPLATVNLSLSQHHKTSVGWFDWVVSGQVRSKYYMTIFNGEGYDAQGNLVPRFQDFQPSYFRADAGVGYTRPDGKTHLEVFVNNATNVAYMTSLISSPDVHIRYYNPPRQFGMRLTMNW
jgi:iron complex outermembrane receptor protein